VRTSGSSDAPTIETFHDRIRETVVASLGPSVLRERHERLARALRERDDVDEETLHFHFHEAGLLGEAREYAVQAADKATRALAFDRAAFYHRMALELHGLHGEDDAEAQRTRVALADALANSGHGPEAADAYLVAASHDVEGRALDLKRRAAEQLLMSGHVDRGLSTISEVLADLGMRLAKTPLAALIGLLLLRAWLFLRGAGFRRRDAAAIPPAVLAKIDVCRAVGFGLAAVDNIRAAHFQSRHLLLALGAGEPSRLSRALAIEATLVSTQGPRSLRRVARLAEVATGLARDLDTAETESSVEIAHASEFYFTGRFARARPHLERAIELIRDRCTGMHWEIDSMQFFHQCTLTYLGALGELARQLPPLLQDAERRGELYLATNLEVGDTSLWWLLRDQPGEARARIENAMKRWSRRGFHLQHTYEGCSLTQIDLYDGNPERALSRADGLFVQMRRAFQTRIHFSRVRLWFVRGRAAIACALTGRLREERLRSATFAPTR